MARTKDGWTLERDHNKLQLGNKQYRNMQEWSRPCTVCGEKFEIFTRANTQAVNSSFGLRTCESHRGQRPSLTAFTPDGNELLALRSYKVTTSAELEGLYARNRELASELDAIKSRLAVYELPAAMANADKLQSPLTFPWQPA